MAVHAAGAQDARSPWREKLDRRRAYELYKLLRDRQAQADAEGLAYEILPPAFRERVIASVNDMKVEDLAVYAFVDVPGKKPKKVLVGGLLHHVDQLRARAGVKPVKAADEEDEAGDEAEAAQDAAAKDPKLAALTRGLKQSALDKALRWLGQQFLKHVFKAWRASLGLSELPTRERKSA